METVEIYPISVFCYPSNQTNFIYLLRESQDIISHFYPNNLINFFYLSRESHDIIAYFSCLEHQILWDEPMRQSIPLLPLNFICDGFSSSESSHSLGQLHLDTELRFSFIIKLKKYYFVSGSPAV
jgi:hypothetical protein